MAENVLIGVAVLALAAAVAAVVLALARSKAASTDAASRLDRLLVETSGAREASQSVDRRFDEMRRSIEVRVEGVERRLAEEQRSLASHLGASGRVLQELGEKLGRLQETSLKIERLAGDVTRLEELLKPPKIRGTLGETFLEQALSQALPPGSWAMQHPLGEGTIVDAAVFVGERIVPVDSKFPLDNYRRARELPDEAERKKAQRAFGADVRRHVDSIAEKYIRPGSGTFDFALMYVPAEAVYSEIVAEGEEAALADYATARRVIPVSPRLLYAYLATIAIGLRGLELQENAREVHRNLAEIAGLWQRAEAPLEKLGNHLENARKQFEETARAFDRATSRLSSITEKAQGALDEIEGPGAASGVRQPA